MNIISIKSIISAGSADNAQATKTPTMGRKDSNATHNTGNLSEAARQARNAAAKAWRAKNKDKVKEYNRRYWEKKAWKEARQEG